MSVTAEILVLGVLGGGGGWCRWVVVCKPILVLSQAEQFQINPLMSYGSRLTVSAFVSPNSTQACSYTFRSKRIPCPSIDNLGLAALIIDKILAPSTTSHLPATSFVGFPNKGAN